MKKSKLGFIWVAANIHHATSLFSNSEKRNMSSFLTKSYKNGKRNGKRRRVKRNGTYNLFCLVNEPVRWYQAPEGEHAQE